jgi:hypothetical protein
MKLEREKEIRKHLSFYEIGPFNEDLVNEVFAEVDKLRAENARLRAALEWIADPYFIDEYARFENYDPQLVAREALGVKDE